MPYGTTATLHCEDGLLFENSMAFWQTQCGLTDTWIPKWSPDTEGCKGTKFNRTFNSKYFQLLHDIFVKFSCFWNGIDSSFLSIASKFLFTSNISAAYSLPFSRILTLKYNVLKYQGISNWSVSVPSCPPLLLQQGEVQLREVGSIISVQTRLPDHDVDGLFYLPMSLLRLTVYNLCFWNIESFGSCLKFPTK